MLTRRKNTKKSLLNIDEHTKHHHLHPTRSLRGISTRLTYKRSPSPSKYFDEGLFYPPSPRNHKQSEIESPITKNIYRELKIGNRESSVSTTYSSSKKKVSSIKSTRNQKILSPSPTSYLKFQHHHLHPTRSLRGVSTRLTYKRSPSPSKYFDEGLLYPPSPIKHHKIGKLKEIYEHLSINNKNNAHYINKSPIRTRSNAKITKKDHTFKSNDEFLLPTFKKKSNLKKKSKKNLKLNTKKTINKSIELTKTKKDVIIENNPIHIDKEQNPKLPKKQIEIKIDAQKSNDKLNHTSEESCFTPSILPHIGWGAKALNIHWKKLISGEYFIKTTLAYPWFENQNKFAHNKNKCLNEYRILNHPILNINPYIYGNICYNYLSECIYQDNQDVYCNLDDTKEIDTNNQPLFKKNNYKSSSNLFELLFIKKQSYVYSLAMYYLINSITYKDIYKQMVTQSLFNFHPNIIRVYQLLESDHSPHTIFVKEYMNHSVMTWNPKILAFELPSLYTPSKTLDNIIIRRVYTEYGAKIIIKEVLNTIKFFHELGIYGLFINPQTIKLSHTPDEEYKEKETLTKTIWEVIHHNCQAETKFENLNKNFKLIDEIERNWDESPTIFLNNPNNFDINILQQKLSDIHKKGRFINSSEYLVNIDQIKEKLDSFSPIQNNDPKRLILKLTDIFANFKHKSRFNQDKNWLYPPETNTTLFNENILCKSDSWNVGVLLHCLLTGRTPYIDSETLFIAENLSEEVKYHLKKLLELDSIKRTGICEFSKSYWINS